MQAQYKSYLDDVVGSQRQDWIHVAIACHLRRAFPYLLREESMQVVKEYCDNKEKCTPAHIFSVTHTRVCGNCKSEYTVLEDDNSLCGCCMEAGVIEDDEI